MTQPPGEVRARVGEQCEPRAARAQGVQHRERGGVDGQPAPVVDRPQLVHVDRELAERHYAEHTEKPFFGELVDFITSSPTLALVLEGEAAISVVRTTIGATNPASAAPGTIRGDLALAMPDNLVHGSDAFESARREIELWFPA